MDFLKFCSTIQVVKVLNNFINYFRCTKYTKFSNTIKCFSIWLFITGRVKVNF